MVHSGHLINVKGAVQLFTAVSTKLQQALNSTVAAVLYRAVATLGFGATGGGDGAVMMIDGRRYGCSRADHGIRITEENTRKFGSPATWL